MPTSFTAVQNRIEATLERLLSVLSFVLIGVVGLVNILIAPMFWTIAFPLAGIACAARLMSTGEPEKAAIFFFAGLAIACVTPLIPKVDLLEDITNKP